MKTFVQLSQLVRLIDMPHYSYMRMQLLKPKRFPELVQSLKSMLMLLPQGKAFDSLKNRLECSEILAGIGEDSDKD